MDANNSVMKATSASVKRFWKVILPVLPSALLPIILLYVFGFSIKTTPEYECAVKKIENNSRVISVTGAPVEPGIFAWTRFFESSGMTR